MAERGGGDLREFLRTTIFEAAPFKHAGNSPDSGF